MRLIRGIFLACLVFLAQSGCKSRPETEPILIGHVGASGDSDKLTREHAKLAILLAVEEANKEGNRIAGRRVAVLHVDSHGDLEALQPEAVRLITVDRVVALLGGASAFEVRRLGQAAQPYEVALVTPASTPPELLTENVFSVNAGLAFQGQVLARFAATELKAERVAILTDGRRPENLALAEAFNQAFSKAADHAPRQWIYKSEAELARAIAESQEIKPQALLFAGAAAELAKTRALLQHAGLTMPLLLADDGNHWAAFAADQRASKQVYLATPYVLEGGTPELQRFAKEYQERFHESPGTDALLAYDGVRVLFQALNRAKSIGAAQVRAELANPAGDDFDSLTGRLIFNKDHSARRPLFVVRLENGKMRDPKRFDPDAP